MALWYYWTVSLLGIDTQVQTYTAENVPLLLLAQQRDNREDIEKAELFSHPIQFDADKNIFFAWLKKKKKCFK